MIGIVSYGMGNVGSIANMLKKVGAEANVSSDARFLAACEKLILPGVGHFGNGMRRLQELGLVDMLAESVLERRTPILGICLGAQLMTRHSEESQEPGLGWIAGDTIRFRFEQADQNLKVPHMGWNTARPMKDSPLFSGMPEPARFYFVHSFYMKLDDDDAKLAESTYGFNFTSGFESGNIRGVQFHPEKSHKFGMTMIRNFSELPGPNAE